MDMRINLKDELFIIKRTLPGLTVSKQAHYYFDETCPLDASQEEKRTLNQA